MRRCIITGGSGFVGSNLAKKLVQEGWKVYLIVREQSNLDAIKEIKEEVEIFRYSGKIDELIDYFKKLKEIDIVFHLASLYLNQHTTEKLNNLLNSNIIFGTHLLEAMSYCNCSKFINTSTFAQHYNNEVYNPVNLYGATKEAFEKILEYYVQVRGIQAISLELFDNYGLNDKRSKVLNLLKRCAITKEHLEMSPGEQLINLLYIDDVINGYIVASQLLENSKGHKKYMLSAGNCISLKELILKVEEIWGEKLNIKLGGRHYQPREVMNPWNKGELLPNWKPQVNLQEGLKLFLKIN